MRNELLNRITIEPDKCGGRPCIRGMRIRVQDILYMLATGASEEEIIERLSLSGARRHPRSPRLSAAYLDHGVIVAKTA